MFPALSSNCCACSVLYDIFYSQLAELPLFSCLISRPTHNIITRLRKKSPDDEAKRSMHQSLFAEHGERPLTRRQHYYEARQFPSMCCYYAPAIKVGTLNNAARLSVCLSHAAVSKTVRFGALLADRKFHAGSQRGRVAKTFSSLKNLGR